MNWRQNIILFSESPKNAWDMPSKIGKTFLNRFVIDEDDACEVLGIYNLRNNNEEDNVEVIGNSLRRASEYRLGIEYDDIHLVFAKNYLNISERITLMILNKMQQYGLRSLIGQGSDFEIL